MSPSPTATPPLSPSSLTTPPAPPNPLATLFHRAALSFLHVHNPSPNTHAHLLALTHLGIQHMRLLIWADIVGLCSPPAELLANYPHHLRRRSVPHPLNPDPDAPPRFGVRHPGLDGEGGREV